MVFKNLLKKRSNKRKPAQHQKQVHEPESGGQEYSEQSAKSRQAPKAKALHLQQEETHEFQHLVDKINHNVEKLLNAPNAWKNGDEELAVFHRDEIVVGDLLGSGGFSDVYEVEAFEPTNDEQFNLYQSLARDFLRGSCASKKAKYAIKHIRPKLQTNERKFCTAAADLVVEAKMLSTLNHPNILGIRGWAADGTSAYGDGSNDGYFLILDRLEETLDQRIKRWNEQGICEFDLHLECARIGTQIASAVDYLHSRNMIFRDLKPSNIGFDANDEVKIFDFGLCRELPSKGVSDSVFEMSGKVGTVRYMSPECALSLPYGVSSDVYSLSMVLYEIANRGSKPFATMNRNDHTQRVCHRGERPELDPSWPLMMQDLLEHCWSQDVSLRPSMSEVANRLQDIVLDMLEVSPDKKPRSASVVVELPIDFSTQKRASKGDNTVAMTASVTEFSESVQGAFVQV